MSDRTDLAALAIDLGLVQEKEISLDMGDAHVREWKRWREQRGITGERDEPAIQQPNTPQQRGYGQNR